MRGLRSVLAAVGLVATATLTTACGGSSGGGQVAASGSTAVNAPAVAQPTALPSPSPSASAPSLGTASSKEWPGLTATINSLHRDAAGAITLVWTLTNGGASSFTIPGNFNSDIYQYHGGGLNGVTLYDPASQERDHPLMDQDQQCECTIFYSNAGTESLLGSGGSATLWGMYKPAGDGAT
ncbi:MAG: hypothetical protein ACRDNW_10995, partial [Trebonia sp.]